MTDNVVQGPGFGRSVRDTAGGGGSGGDADMSARVERLEADVKEIKADVKGMAKDQQALRADIAEIKGRLSQMPTTFQMVTWLVGVAMGLVALVFTVARAVK